MTALDQTLKALQTFYAQNRDALLRDQLETSFSRYLEAVEAPHAPLCPALKYYGSVEHCHCRRALNIERALGPYQEAARACRDAGATLWSAKRLEKELAG